MSETLIASLNGRISELTNELAETRAEAKKHRQGKAEIKAQLDALAKDHEAAVKERDGLKVQAQAAPSELQAKLDEATSALRSRDHRDAFKDAVGAELNDKVAVEDVWSKLQYKPGEALPTPEQITELVGKAREAAPYLFKPAGETPAAGPGGSQQPQKAPLQGAVGGGRGGPDNAGRFVVRSSDLANGDWVDANWARYQAAVKDGTAVMVP